MDIKKTEQGDTAKRRNHTVPKCLLKRWMVKENGIDGFWVLDCVTRTVSFNAGEKASFAIRDYRYVPIRQRVGGQPFRDDDVEDFFADDESDLASVTDHLLAGTLKNVAPRAIRNFLSACVMLAYRSWYEYECVEKQILVQHPYWSVDDAARRTVDAYRIVYKQHAPNFSNWDYEVVSGFSAPLLVCDRPTFDATVRDIGALTLPLTPDLFLIAHPPLDQKRKSATLTVSPLVQPKKNVDGLNFMTIQRAREFIVGTEAQLKAIVGEFESAKFAARKATDKFTGIVSLAINLPPPASMRRPKTGSTPAS